MFIHGCNNKPMKESLDQIYNAGKRDTYPITIDATVQLFNSKYPVIYSHKKQQINIDNKTTHRAPPEEAREGNLIALHAVPKTAETEDQVEMDLPTLTTINGTKTTGMARENDPNWLKTGLLPIEFCLICWAWWRTLYQQKQEVTKHEVEGITNLYPSQEVMGMSETL